MGSPVLGATDPPETLYGLPTRFDRVAVGVVGWCSIELPEATVDIVALIVIAIIVVAGPSVLVPLIALWLLWVFYRAIFGRRS